MKEDFGYNFNVILDKKRVREKKSEVFRLIASNTKAKKILNWKPKFTFSQLVSDMVNSDIKLVSKQNY